MDVEATLEWLANGAAVLPTHAAGGCAVYRYLQRCKLIRGARAEPQVSLPTHRHWPWRYRYSWAAASGATSPKLAQALCLTIAPEPDAICALLCLFVAERKEPGCPLERAKEGTALG